MYCKAAHNEYVENFDAFKTRLRLGQMALCADELRQWLRSAHLDDPARLDALALLADALAGIPSAAEELLAVSNEVADQAPRDDQQLLLAAALCHRSLAYRRLGLRSEASQDALQALRLAREAGSLALQSRALYASACLPMDACNFTEARQLLGESLACAEADGSPSTIFSPLNSLTHIIGVEAADLAAAGEHAAARIKVAELVEFAGRALAIARADGHALNEAFALSNLADAYIIQGDTQRARDLINAYGDLARRVGFSRLQAYAKLDEVRLMRAAGQLDEAIAVLTSPTLAELLPGNDDIDLTRVQFLYELHKAQSRFDLALQHHEQLAKAQSRMNADRAASMQRVLLARLDLESAQAAAERARLEAQTERLRAQMLERERDQHRYESLHDPLTGLANRRAADAQWEERAARAALHGEFFFVAIVDIDHFKRVNDTHGHSNGDAVLAETGRVLHDLLRRRDGLYRLGGEEFLVLMSDGSAGAGLAACERLRVGLAVVDWSRVVPGLQITVSVGLTCRRDGESQIVLLERADSALYAAKSAGRNRCEQR
jgi:diguanylate cyclase (GGDEF)-like protein